MVFDTFKGLSPALQSQYWKEAIAKQSYTYPNHGEREYRMTQTLSSTEYKSTRDLRRVDMSRCGYTGFIPSKTSENICGQTYQEVKSTARRLAKDRASGEEFRRVASGLVPKSPVQRTASEPTLSSTTGFESSSPSMFKNHLGTSARPGAAIPGYAGFIPGKVAGSVHGKRVAEANLQATQVRLGKYGGAPLDTNWLVGSEYDRRENMMGAGLTGESWRSRSMSSLTASQALPSGGSWVPFQPMSTHEWLKESPAQTRGFPGPP